jgi:hypothetical protein
VVSRPHFLRFFVTLDPLQDIRLVRVIRWWKPVADSKTGTNSADHTDFIPIPYRFWTGFPACDPEIATISFSFGAGNPRARA